MTVAPSKLVKRINRLQIGSRGGYFFLFFVVIVEML